MESSPESTITQAFNPFVTTQAAYGMGATGLIYEPLIQFDLADPTVATRGWPPPTSGATAASRSPSRSAPA